MNAPVNQQVRTGESVDGGIVVLGVWCPRCREEVGPKWDGTCPFCGELVYDEERLSAREARAAINLDGGHMSETATLVACKVEGCELPFVDFRGPYAKLCAQHKEEAKQRPRATRRSVSGAALVDQAKALVPLARKLDQARAKLAKLPDTQDAKTEFAEASRRASSDPSPENLARVVAATKLFGAGGAKRSKLEEDEARAAQALTEAVEALAGAV